MKKNQNQNAVVAQTVVPANELLNKINAIGITDKLTEKNSVRSIFKKEFNNKKDRTQCRTKFQNAISMFLLHTAHAKKELADAQLLIAREIAKKYYVAEDKFASANNYANANMDDNKKSAISMFVELQKEI